MAARAHDVAAIALRGRNACLNFADSWRLPVLASSEAKDIQKAAAEAAEAFRPSKNDNATESTSSETLELQQYRHAGRCISIIDKGTFLVSEFKGSMECEPGRGHQHSVNSSNTRLGEHKVDLVDFSDRALQIGVNGHSKVEVGGFLRDDKNKVQMTNQSKDSRD
ncbi:hypothetical protein POM88_042191 [Heracleum sosnowskyi]|uniref:AP2/ERF domain-containing protein n=1 Tax=Heracleum sosnowskyi TaxID=360622 RepID=A0AAD8M8Z4_9APIA|nr:hypothetical protein POM88_042191 [Heracleum sosnowskyi]